jgi:hypothetical protein
MVRWVRRFFSSPRRRRRAAGLAVVASAAGIALGIGLAWPNTVHNTSTFSRGKPKVIHEEPASRPLPKRDRRSSEQVLDAFVTSAVVRKHLDRSYDLVTENMRSGMSRAAWRTGDIPVPAFPAKDFALAKSKLSYSHGNIARYDVVILARANAETSSGLFSIELHALTRGGQRRWLVDYFEPIGGGIYTPATPRANPLSVRADTETSSSSQPLGTAWVLAPLAVLSLIVLVPLALGIRGWLRNRRADRDYTKTLPPLPPRS